MRSIEPVMALRVKPEGVADRVLRGGSWDRIADDARSAYRFLYVPVGRYGVVGFRPAQVIPGSFTS